MSASKKITDKGINTFPIWVQQQMGLFMAFQAGIHAQIDGLYFFLVGNNFYMHACFLTNDRYNGMRIVRIT
jgi:hypothetical protein